MKYVFYLHDPVGFFDANIAKNGLEWLYRGGCIVQLHRTPYKVDRTKNPVLSRV